jgi:hypothetical protein
MLPGSKTGNVTFWLFQALMLVKMSMLVLWVVTPSGLVHRYNLGQTTWCVSDHYGQDIWLWWKSWPRHAENMSQVSVLDSSSSHAVQQSNMFSIISRITINVLELWHHPHTKLFADYNTNILEKHTVSISRAEDWLRWCFSETLVSTCKSTWCYNPEDEQQQAHNYIHIITYIQYTWADTIKSMYQGTSTSKDIHERSD